MNERKIRKPVPQRIACGGERQQTLTLIVSVRGLCDEIPADLRGDDSAQGDAFELEGATEVSLD